MTTSTSIEAMNHLVCELLAQRYPDSAYCFFYGSAARGAFRENSDLDLIIVNKALTTSYREKFLFKGFLMDVFVYDAESLNGMLHMARTSGMFVTVDAITTATILPQSCAEAELLKSVARRVRKAGYLFTTRDVQRQQLTGLLDDLDDSTLPTERNMLCVDLFKTCVDLLLVRAGAGVSTRKQAARELGAANAFLQVQLDKALADALGGQPGALIAIALKVLAQFGGALREGFRMNCPVAPRMPLPS